jgi:hypothetical protein
MEGDMRRGYKQPKLVDKVKSLIEADAISLDRVRCYDNSLESIPAKTGRTSRTHGFERVIIERNQKHRVRLKKEKRMKEIFKRGKEVLAKQGSDHNCIRRGKRTYSKEEADVYIKGYKQKKLGKYYCKKCRGWHLTSKLEVSNGDT